MEYVQFGITTKDRMTEEDRLKKAIRVLRLKGVQIPEDQEPWVEYHDDESTVACIAVDEATSERLEQEEIISFEDGGTSVEAEMP